MDVAMEANLPCRAEAGAIEVQLVWDEHERLSQNDRALPIALLARQAREANREFDRHDKQAKRSRP
jgi:hypothetical protein